MLPAHPALRFAGQPPSPPKAGPVPATVSLAGDRTAARPRRLPPIQPGAGPTSPALPQVRRGRPDSRWFLARLSLARTTTTGYLTTLRRLIATAHTLLHRQRAPVVRLHAPSPFAETLHSSIYQPVGMPASASSLHTAPARSPETITPPIYFPLLSHSPQPQHSFSINRLYPAV